MRFESVETYKITEGGVELTSGKIRLAVTLVEDNILRLWSTVEEDFRPTQSFVVQRNEFSLPKVEKTEGHDSVTLRGGELSVEVFFDPFRLAVSDHSGGAILSTPAGESVEWNGAKGIQRFDLPDGIRVYGLGQGTNRVLDLRDTERRMWQQWDAFRYNGNGGIPFLFTSAGYGLLFNSSWASRFAIGRAQPSPCTKVAKPEGPWKADEHSGEDHPQRLAVLAEGGDLDFFIIYGPDCKRIIRGYADLTGHAPLLPRWALGWIQSKNRYKSQEQLLEVGREFRRRGIPCDVLVIDWCWFERFGYLEWVRRYWPDPIGLARELRAMGFHLLQAQHPYMHRESPHFHDFSDAGYLISWDPADVQPGWPPDGIRHAVDFTNPGARQLWWKKIEPLFLQGVDGYWIDMGELETHPPGTSAHWLGPREQVHNIYSTLWAKALYDGQRSISHRRVFSLPRTAFAGIQRYSTATWSGDIDPSWEVLEDQVVVGQQVCLSGQPYWTTDIGGFMSADLYEPELFVRWTQWGAFCPLFRTHGTRPENEPWSFGRSAEEIIETFIRLRYRLMPYIYSLSRETSQTGLSMMRAMAVEFPDDRESVSRDHQFMFGPSLLVAPVTRKGQRERLLWLPEGSWFSYWDDEKRVGPREVSEAAPLWRIPLFVRGGSIIPTGPDALHTGEHPLDPLTLHVYPGADAHFALYEDDGLTYDYERGAHVVTEISYNETGRRLAISAAQGGYKGFPVARTLRIVFHDFDSPREVRENGVALNAPFWSYERGLRRLEVELPATSTSTPTTLEIAGMREEKSAADVKMEQGLFSGYDLESTESPAGYLLRVYLENGAPEPPTRVSISIRCPTGWSCDPIDGDSLLVGAGGHEVARFVLAAGGSSITALSRATITITSPRGEERKEVCLGSGWNTWWKVAGPYEVDGPEGFEKVYAPERGGQIEEKNLEKGINLLSVCKLECFGYVNLDKLFQTMNIVELVAAIPGYKLCYAACIAKSPSSRECLLQLMGEDRFKVWVNDKLVAIVHDCAARPAEFLVRLLEGRNRVLIKCSQDAHREWNDRAWGFHFRFVDDSRSPLDDVTYSIEGKA